MKKPVVLRRKADEDIDAALDHYLSEAPEVAPALVSAVEATLASIGNTPAIGSARYARLLDIPELRFRKTRRFPYLVFYIEGPRVIAILRVLHESRDIPAGFEPD